MNTREGSHSLLILCKNACKLRGLDSSYESVRSFGSQRKPICLFEATNSSLTVLLVYTISQENLPFTSSFKNIPLKKKNSSLSLSFLILSFHTQELALNALTD